jgi:hypothetical protein
MSVLLAALLAHVVIHVDTTHRVQTIRPWYAFGSTVDKEPAGSIPSLYSKRNVRQILDSGLGFLSYRLFTELTDEDWHWNPSGSFSQGTRGYWTSSATPGAVITDSFGYRLPMTGNSTDEGASESYSRADDGDAQTYWKSNPYLSSHFTGESDALHPQWIVVDLAKRKPVDALRIRWANPYAETYDAGYWTGSDAFGDPAGGRWQHFALGHIERARGGVQIVRVAPLPVRARFVRVLMSRSSNTCDSHGAADSRDCLGYAIAEIGVGTIDPDGRFHDVVSHAPSRALQTTTYVSSVDPWHGAENRVRNQEQPGLDLIARSGLTRGVGAIYPIPLWYSTPQNAANEVRYLLARHYPVAYIEMGEEIDGQYAAPEDYAALYLQYAKALHAVDPGLKLGGPAFQGTNSDTKWWPDASGDTSWLHRFLEYLRAHRAMNDLSFMSFEHYPFGGCEHGARLQRDLLVEPSIVRTVVHAWRADGSPANVPMFVTEAGFSATNFTQVPMQIEGALWQADYMGGFLSQGVRRVVYYQDEPVPLSQNRGCKPDWGNLTMFVAGAHGNIRARGAQFYASQLIATQWMQPGNAPADIYAAQGSAGSIVTAYAARRADGTWSLLIDNKDTKPHRVSIAFDTRGGVRHFTGRLEIVRFGPQQYKWVNRGAASLPKPDAGLKHETLNATAKTTYMLAARSLTVIRGAANGY